MTSIASIPEGAVLLSEPAVSAGRVVCLCGGRWVGALASAGVALTFDVSGDSAETLDFAWASGGVFTEGLGVELLERGVAFFFEPLLSVAGSVFERFLAVISLVPFLHVASLASGSLLNWVSICLSSRKGYQKRGPTVRYSYPALRKAFALY